MKKSGFALLLATIVVTLSACSTPSNTQIVIVTSTPAPVTLAPTNVDPTVVAPTAITVAPTSTPSEKPAGDPKWTTAWNVPYTNMVQWTAPYTCPPLHVCEWWDQKADGYEHEGFVVTLEGESVDFPAIAGSLLDPIVYVGTSWEVKSNEDAQRLITTYRHLVFYANQFDQSYWTEIFGAELYNRYLGGLVIEAKPQHFYMAEFTCDFKDQDQCPELDAKVRHLPNGINLNRGK